jgi:tetrapyrrole methylase family protein/MazG family protein
MAALRAPDGCPWDREQDHASLRQYLLEEAHEAIEAIDEKDYAGLCGELGDILLQVVFHARLAEEAGRFDFHDVVSGIVDKMQRRHPHVFGSTSVKNADEVIKNWEAIKKDEYRQRQSVLDGVPKSLPALFAAAKLQGKAARVGFDWPSTAGIRQKIQEELNELDDAEKTGSREEMEKELGDVLFALSNLARRLDINPEIALSRSIVKFKKRFAHVEKMVNESGKEWQFFSLEELDEFWQQAKKLGIY